MNLAALRTEVLAHGFDPTAFSSRITQYLNDCQNLIARRVDYWQSENTSDFSTVSGTSTYALPADYARGKSLRDTGRTLEMEEVGERDIDTSIAVNAPPSYYATTRTGLRLYPTPDGVYTMELRYWQLPTAMVGDGDVPAIPADWHNMLLPYAIARCYKAEDDFVTGGQWMADFEKLLAEFAADQKFPSTDYPTQAADMWQGGRSLRGPGWSIYGTTWGY